MKQVKKLKRVYLGRRVGAGYEIGSRLKAFSELYGFHQKYLLQGFCTDNFERVTGIHLEPGKVQRVEITVRPYGEVCEWESDYSYPRYKYTTSCGNFYSEFIFNTSEQRFTYCPGCGKPVKEATK